MVAKRKSIEEKNQERDSLFPSNQKKNEQERVTPKKETVPEFVPTKKNITKLIEQQGSSARKADSIRINPILIKALTYWTSIAEPNKSKPDVIEEALLKVIPEEYLIEGYTLANRQTK
jgi:hypothetical protein